MAVIGLAIAEAIVALMHGNQINWTDLGVHVAAGSALLNARDNGVSTEQVQKSKDGDNPQ